MQKKLTQKRKEILAENAWTTQVQFWIMCALPLFLIILFCYVPMGGIIIAFKDYRYSDGIFGSKWNGLDNFKLFFNSDEFLKIASNTLIMNGTFIVVGIIAAVTLAILLYDVRSRNLTKIFQTVLITPNFISWVIVAYMVYGFLNPRMGILNTFLNNFGIESIDWYSKPGAWPYILTIANVWKNVGMDSIIYYATLMEIDASLFEAADIDGANKLQKIRAITLPTLVPLITMLTILKIGGIFGGDFGLFYQVTRDVGALYETTDIMSTWIFRTMRSGSMGISAAAGLLQSVVGMVLVILTNTIVKKIDSDMSLF